MFQFLQPILLFSVAATAIPVAIHLWNIKQGKTLKVGSISLLTQGSRQQARSFKLIDLLLLFLRCLLLVLLAFLLAQPLWQQQLSVQKEKGWVLIEKENLHETYLRFQPKIDSFLKSGYAFHYFNPGFTKDDLQQAITIQKDTISSRLSYWSLLKELNRQVPSTLPIYVFSKNSLKRFKGTRPAVALQLHWQTFVPADTVSTFPADAFLTSADSIRLGTGHSQPTSTYYTYRNISLKQMSSDEANVHVNNGKLMVSLQTDGIGKNNIDTNAIDVDTSAIRITIFTDKFLNDAGFVKAAIDAIKKFSNRKIILSVSNNFSDISANQNWIFWLSEQPLPETISAKNIVKYESGKEVNINSWINTENEISLNKQTIAITKNVPEKASKYVSEVIWKDGFGQAVLDKEQQPNMSVFHLYSHFNPDWNDLVWSDEFPLLIMKLIVNQEETLNDTNDKRIIDEKQLQPVINGENATVTNDKFTSKIDLSHFFWLAAFVIFFIERLISFKNKKTI